MCHLINCPPIPHSRTKEAPFNHYQCLYLFFNECSQPYWVGWLYICKSHLDTIVVKPVFPIHLLSLHKAADHVSFMPWICLKLKLQHSKRHHKWGYFSANQSGKC